MRKGEHPAGNFHAFPAFARRREDQHLIVARGDGQAVLAEELTLEARQRARVAISAVQNRTRFIQIFNVESVCAWPVRRRW
jgi:hypothetical protein